MAGHLWVVDDVASCLTWAERALELSHELGLHREEVLALQYRGASRSKLGDEAGLDDLRAALQLGIEAGLGDETAVAYNNYAYELWYHRGAAESARVWQEMAAFCQTRGLATSYAWAHGGLLEPLFDMGEWEHVLSTAGWLRGWDADHGGETQPGSVAVQFQGWVTLRRGDHERRIRAWPVFPDQSGSFELTPRFARRLLVLFSMMLISAIHGLTANDAFS
jgi:hypothetical protein